MIELSNGDKWILDDSEHKDIPYKEAIKGNIPLMKKREFIDQICNSVNDKCEVYYIPRKLTTQMNGYWDANFDVFAEVFGDIAIKTKKLPWADIYIMPWDEVIVVYTTVDCGGYDACNGIAKYKDYDEYLEITTI